MNQPSRAHIAKITKQARQLIAYHYPRKKISVTRLSGGITNFVFGVTVGKENLVVRISELREKINFFFKEQWAMAMAKSKGIPVPEILEVGNDIIPLPYMIQRRINGEEASKHPMKAEILKELGHYAALIHTIRTNGFGHMFDWSQNTLSKNNTWKEFLRSELRAAERIEILRKHKMLTQKSLGRLSSELGKIEGWTQSPCLNHGDLRLKNTMVNKEGKIIAIIDWENCISCIAPYWDTSIALHDLSIDSQWRYLEGYGMKDKQLIEIAPALKVFNLLNYAPVIEQMAMQKQKEALSHYRARLQGALDMFSI